MKSNFCKHDEHAGCAPHGRMISPEGKHFRCDCTCHPKPSLVKRMVEDEDDDDD